MSISPSVRNVALCHFMCVSVANDKVVLPINQTRGCDTETSLNWVLNHKITFRPNVNLCIFYQFLRTWKGRRRYCHCVVSNHATYQNIKHTAYQIRLSFSSQTIVFIFIVFVLFQIVRYILNRTCVCCIINMSELAAQFQFVFKFCFTMNINAHIS